MSRSRGYSRDDRKHALMQTCPFCSNCHRELVRKPFLPNSAFLIRGKLSCEACVKTVRAAEVRRRLIAQGIEIPSDVSIPTELERGQRLPEPVQKILDQRRAEIARFDREQRYAVGSPLLAAGSTEIAEFDDRQSEFDLSQGQSEFIQGACLTTSTLQDILNERRRQRQRAEPVAAIRQ